MIGRHALFDCRPSSSMHTPAQIFGAIAQLVERLVRNEKVRGSNPLSSTTLLSGVPIA